MGDTIRKLFAAIALPARDDHGSVEHPDLDRFTTDRDGEQYVNVALLTESGWEYCWLELESGDDEPAINRYFEEGDPDFSGWNPKAPEGDWQLAGIWESEGGPVAFYVREVVTA